MGGGDGRRGEWRGEREREGREEEEEEERNPILH